MKCTIRTAQTWPKHALISSSDLLIFSDHLAHKILLIEFKSRFKFEFPHPQVRPTSLTQGKGNPMRKRCCNKGSTTLIGKPLENYWKTIQAFRGHI